MTKLDRSYIEKLLGQIDALYNWYVNESEGRAFHIGYSPATLATVEPSPKYFIKTRLDKTYYEVLGLLKAERKGGESYEEACGEATSYTFVWTPTRFS